MPEDYEVKDGDCIGSIAFEHGFFWESLWNLPENATLKEKRKNPNVLLPGDTVHIPDLRPKEEQGATAEKHQFRLKGVPAKFQLRLMDDSKPRTDVEYTLEIEGKTVEGRTNQNAEIEATIPPNAREGRLRVKNGKIWEEYNLQLGHLDPAENVTGAQARLGNFGFDTGEEEGVIGTLTKAGLIWFQTLAGLEATGRLDQATIDALKNWHDDGKVTKASKAGDPPTGGKQWEAPDLTDAKQTTDMIESVDEQEPATQPDWEDEPDEEIPSSSEEIAPPTSPDALIATYDCEHPFDVSKVDEPPPEVPGMTYGGERTALALDAKVQRCETSKSKSTCNVLNKVRRSCVLKIEPLPQFAFSGDSGKGGTGKLILEEFYSGSEQGQITNPSQNSKRPVPDPLYRAWGPQFYSAWPARTEATGTVHGTSCGMHCFTQVVRYLQKKGEAKTVYDRMMDALKPRDNDHKEVLRQSAPVMTSAALKEDASLKPIFDTAKTEKKQALWDAELKTHYKFWYPIWVLWWVRASEGTTWEKDGWTKRKDPMINRRGIFLWQRFVEWSKKPKKDPPSDADEIAKAKVPKLLKELGLCMIEGHRNGRVKAAIAETMQAIDQGYPVVTLRPGHFVLIIGYVQDDKGLKFVINDSGRNTIQYFIDPYIPHTIEEGGGKKVPGELLIRDPAAPEEEWREGADMEACKKQLQNKGYHVMEDGKEMPPPSKWTRKTMKVKGEDKKRQVEVKQITYEFTYDWKHTSFWWKEYWILKFSDGEPEKKCLKLKST